MTHLLYTPFDKFVFRTPRYPFSSIRKHNEYLSFFSEDLFVASPELFQELKRCEGSLSEKLQEAIYKYWTRACSRATPFGLFACCSVGNFVDKGSCSITVSKPDSIKRKTRLDLGYLCSLIHYLESLDFVRSQLKYYPNDSIYAIGDRIRFIEYYNEGINRIHVIQEIENNDIISLLIKRAKEGLTIDELAFTILSDDISKEDASHYINDLIDSQILKSEIEVDVTGGDALSGVITSLMGKKGLERIVFGLSEIEKCLSAIDKSLTHIEENYDRLYNLLSVFPVKYEKKYLLQVDSFRNTQASSLLYSDVSSVQKAIDFLTRIHSGRKGNMNINSFTQAFVNRYESQEIPLLEAIDANIGLGYPLGSSQKVSNPLVDGMAIGSSNKSKNGLELTEEEVVILRKIVFRQETGIPEEIILNEGDIILKKEISNDSLPSTIAAMCQILSCKDKKVIILKSVGGATAASLLGRFCYLDESLQKLVIEICDFEQKSIGPDMIVCEINHLPASRIGNISSRPILRRKEIHYLAGSGIKNKDSIPASDLILVYKGGRLLLKDKTTGAILLPKLSNAHNYRLNTTPVYQFLCDYQYANTTIVYNINTDSLFTLMGYCPRIKYENVILSLRKWIIKYANVFKMRWKTFGEEEDIVLLRYIKTINIPSRFVVKEGDNDLFFDMDYPLSRKVFCNYLKQKDKLIIEEFLSDERGLLISDGEEKYCAEFIIPYKVQTDND